MLKIVEKLSEKLDLKQDEVLEKLGLKKDSTIEELRDLLGVYSIFEKKEMLFQMCLWIETKIRFLKKRNYTD